MPVLRITEDEFLLDDRPFRILSGAVHYFRVHPGRWADRLRKARLMGLNTVETYVPWNLHEPRPGEFTTAGLLDLPRFLDSAVDAGLHVLLRPGPYICAEWDGGGLPAWLLAEPDIRLRTTDSRFLTAVDRYLDALIPRVLPYLSTAGGPILAVQVENEYGAYPGVSDDERAAYLAYLADALTARGIDVPLFTADQPADLKRGALPGAFATVTMGGHIADGLAALRKFRPDAPLMCSEFWNGWFDHWGGPHAVRPADDAAADLDALLAADASVSIYMFHGGTNFGFTNGANDTDAAGDEINYRPIVTSYDYDAPLSESGDLTPKYTAFRSVLARYAPVPDEPLPQAGAKLARTGIELPHTAALFGNLEALGGARTARRPLTMVELGQESGFILYETLLPHAGSVQLRVEGIRDRAQVFLDNRPVQVLSREHDESVLTLEVPAPGCRLTLLVENQGRINYGAALHDRKGIIGPVTIDGAALTGWTSRPLPLDDLTGLTFDTARPTGPAFCRGTVEIDTPADTFLSLPGWTKGVAWINAFPLGRFWSRGPQRTLYVPAPILHPGDNEITILELHTVTTPTVHLVPAPDLGPTAL